ncbi:MAG: hypothetical protein HFE30_02700 [Clostridiales bacterium]|nr:hypothetical protein [Clostridiales bacterium]
MELRCIWEHNGNDSLLYSGNYIGAFTRGASIETTIQKMRTEIHSYLTWLGKDIPNITGIEVIQEKESDLQIKDADTEVIFDSEREPLSKDEYFELKSIALKSAYDFEMLYHLIPDKDKSVIKPRNTFYGIIPATAYEMIEHTKCVNPYYFGEIGVKADTNGGLPECRKAGFDILEQRSDFLDNIVYRGSFGEEWSLKKVIRRFIWHDRIHAKAMWRMACKTFGNRAVENIFKFEI